MAKGRWEHLHVVNIYLVRPDGSGLKRLSQHGEFCGSPKWPRDSKSIVAYCMPAQDTWTYRSQWIKVKRSCFVSMYQAAPPTI